MVKSFADQPRTATMEARGSDFYPTPYAALPPLLALEGKKMPKCVIEPACGNGAIVVPLRNRGYDVLATDLHDWGCPFSYDGFDFLGEAADRMMRKLVEDRGGECGIITNPPFGMAEQFIERAVSIAPYAAFLVRLAFLESEGRMTWFRRVGLRRVHVISDRLPMLHREGYEGKKLDKSGIPFCWMIFQKTPRPAPFVQLRFVSWKTAAKKFPQTEADVPPSAEGYLPLFGKNAA